ncbi:TetR/AcrR family transcriptional regulator [Companilactobacillus huachuanensis]|uniref:TetR/AcrR family transcriptional regulator n=1 Tax=Companilactobacillus huachuanensis TaxID=2559914 RepID=A0ABW1RHR3_9LACO|nr:TetR/AcrR family transcriptional regulator [Companilactobacillus huachuanensis]
MRKIDEAKKQAITKAVFQITYDEGITNLSIAKIARQVGISKATMYVYYVDKTDMLSKIFLEVKQLMDTGLDEKMKSSLPFNQRAYNAVSHFAEGFVEYPYEANFMRAIMSNPALVNDGVIEQSQKLVQSLYDLFAEGVENGHWITNDMEILTAIIFSPVVEFTENYFRMGQPVPKDKLTELIDILISTNVVE